MSSGTRCAGNAVDAVRVDCDRSVVMAAFIREQGSAGIAQYAVKEGARKGA